MTDAAVRDTYVRHVENQTNWLKEVYREVSMQSAVTLDYIDALRKRIGMTADVLNAKLPYISDEIENPESYDEFKHVTLHDMSVVFDNWRKYKLLQKNLDALQKTIASFEKTVDKIDKLNKSIMFTSKGEIPTEKPVSLKKSVEALCTIEERVSEEVDPGGKMCDPTQRSASLVRDYFCTLIGAILNSSLRLVDITDRVLKSLEEDNYHRLYWACQVILGQCSIAYPIDKYSMDREDVEWPEL